MDYSEMISFLVKEKQKGKSYSDIRIILEKQNIDKYKVAQIIREVDSLIVEKDKNRHNKTQAKNIMLLGLAMITIQLIIDFYRKFDFTDYWSLLLSFASVVSGGVIFIKGYKKYKKSY